MLSLSIKCHSNETSPRLNYNENSDTNAQVLTEKETATDLRYDGAGFVYSFVMFVVRSTYQIVRNNSLLATDVAMQFFAGSVIGLLYRNVNFKKLPQAHFTLAMMLCLTISVNSLRVFGNERLVFWREMAPGTGMNLDSLAYFLAKNLVEIPRIMLLVVVFLSTFSCPYNNNNIIIIIIINNNNRHVLSLRQANHILLRVLFGILLYRLEHYWSFICSKCDDGTQISTISNGDLNAHYCSVLWS